MTLSYWLMGYRELTVSAGEAATLLELCRSCGFAYDGFTTRSDGCVSLRFGLKDARRVLEACQARALPLVVTVTRMGGLPSLLRRAAARPGLLAGLCVSVFLLVLSGRFVWDVRVEGNDILSGRDVESALSACGFGVGSSLADFHADRIENRVLLQDGRIAWISINMKGTVAYVQVREASRAPAAESTQPANIVATRSGRIERIELDEGNVLVSAGDLVDEGDLLISGLYDSNRVGIRATRASARVYARTVREFYITVPLEYEEKVYLGDADAGWDGWISEKELIFFGKSVKFSKKTGNMGVMCDTIERTESLGLIAGIGFPIARRTVWYLPYTTAVSTRTPAEAEELAYYELSRRIGEIPGGAELISKRITTSLGEDAYRLTCTLVCVEDIARVQEFEITE